MRATVYTDGACSKDGRGGWAWVLVDGDRFVAEDYGGEAGTTNNRMELLAVIKGISWTPSWADPLQVVSDSAYVVNCFLERWYEGWLERGWVTSAKKPVANQDLWEELLGLGEERSLEWSHVKGHNGDRWNERADWLAVRARERLS